MFAREPVSGFPGQAGRGEPARRFSGEDFRARRSRLKARRGRKTGPRLGPGPESAGFRGPRMRTQEKGVMVKGGNTAAGSDADLELLKAELDRARSQIGVLQEKLKESDRGLLAMSMEIESLVAQRTSELTNANLELKESIRKLEQSREELQKKALFPLRNPNPIMSLSPEGEILFSNKSSQPIISAWGYPHADEFSEKWNQILHDVDRTGGHRHLDMKIGDRIFSVTFAPVAGENAINIYAHDITDRKKAEQSLQWELEVNSSLVGLARELIARPGDIAAIAEIVLRYARNITNSGYGMVSSVDHATGQNVIQAFTKMTRDQRVGDNDAPAAFGCDEEGNYPGLWGHCLNSRTALFTNEPATHPMTTDPPQGHTPVKGFLTVPVLIGNELSGQVAVADPVHCYDRQDLQAMEQLAGIYALAFQRIREENKRSELEKRYRHVQKMEAVGTMAGGISHDFNNILAAMMGYANLSLIELPADSSISHNLNQVIKAGERARNLIKQILAFSRRDDQETAPMNIAPVIKEGLKLMRSSLPSSIEIEQFVDNEPGNVMAEPGAIHQVLMNLCNNASQAMRKDGGLLSVRLKRLDAGSPELPLELREKNREFLLFGVEDNGVGIESKILHRIFEPYFTTKETNEGTGLGLAVVHGIVDSLGGVISVESKPAKGTTVSIYLPVCDKEKVEAANEELLPMGSGEHILFVDDEKALVEIARHYLPRMGYLVSGHDSPQAALEAFQRDPWSFDLVMTDLTMPKITGDKLSAEVKRIRPDIPVILCTGYSELVTEESARKFDVEAMLLKPLDDHKLSETLRLLLENEV